MPKDFKCPHCNIPFTIPFPELIHLVKTEESSEKECDECGERFVIQHKDENGMNITKYENE